MRVSWSRFLLAVLFLLVLNHIWLKDVFRQNQPLSEQIQLLEEVLATPPPAGTKRTYVTTYYYVGQQGAGARSIVSLQCFLSSLEQSYWLVEPYIEDTWLKGYTTSTVDGVLKFSDIFDMDHFNAVSREGNRIEMTPVEDFIRFSPNYTILVSVQLKSKGRAVLRTSQPKDGNFECIKDYVIDEILQLTKPSKPSVALKNIKTFSCVVRIVELPMYKADIGISDENTSVKIEDFIFGGWSPQDVTIVVSHWAGPFNAPSFTSKRNCFREYNTTITGHLYTPAKRLLRDAKRYEDMFLGGKNKLAVMLRVEKVVRYYLKEGKSMKGCFDEVLSLSRDLGNSSAFWRPLVTMDMGTFGSASFHKIGALTKELSWKTLLSLYHDKWSLKDWEESFIRAADGLTNKAYIAALQRTLASRADCLVLMGGGNFQTLAVEGYLKYHEKSKTCIHMVCEVTTRPGGRMVQRLMNNPDGD